MFTLKELESVLPKAKGITQQSVKEILQSLQSDGLVDFDKIGSGNFFWSLPSKELVQKRLRVEKAESGLKAARDKMSAMEERKKVASKSRIANSAREAKLRKLREYQTEIKALDRELAQLQEFGPEKLKDLELKSVEARSAANRWTENVYSLIAFMKKKNESIETAMMLKQAGLPADMEEVE